MKTSHPTLLVLRGNSGSGKSTVARTVQLSLPRATCAVLSQDAIRRELLREPDEPEMFNILLIEQLVTTCLREGRHVILEGILDARRYGAMLRRLRDANPGATRFYAYDLSFDETVRRHATRAKSAEFTADDMKRWFVGPQRLDFADEALLDASVSLADAVQRFRAALLS